MFYSGSISKHAGIIREPIVSKCCIRHSLVGKSQDSFVIVGPERFLTIEMSSTRAETQIERYKVSITPKFEIVEALEALTTVQTRLISQSHMQYLSIQTRRSRLLNQTKTSNPAQILTYAPPFKSNQASKTSRICAC